MDKCLFVAKSVSSTVWSPAYSGLTRPQLVDLGGGTCASWITKVCVEDDLGMRGYNIDNLISNPALGTEACR